MSSIDHSRLRELFIAACDLGESEQAALIDEQCADDPDLRDRLERLLRNDESTRGILREENVGAGIDIHIDAIGGHDAPARIGRYTVRRLIGEGGMGAVYLAEQENPKRDVAVKVIRAGIMNRELHRRFDLEAAVLGRLQHPGIAQVYEAGMFDDGSGGRPYFAMEYVDGLPLGEFLRTRNMSVRERLMMFIHICNAVHHAHQRGIIHRDLKPGNILVDESGNPKVLDFGVARAIDSDLQISTLQTDVGQLIGTLPYMSPEQVTGRAGDLDTRSDVYALGVILYEMLAGRLPYDLKDRAIVTAAKVISEDEPAPLTTISRTYRGDLNTIVLKALEKDAGRRYQSASDLAADVQHYLNNEPIVARPATTMYQLRKFARRNKGLVAGVVAAFIVLIAGVVATSVFAVGQTHALRESERQRDIANAVNTFLNEDLLGSANPYTGTDHDATLREVLDRAAEAIEGRFLDQPLVHASVRATLGHTYLQLGEFKAAARHVESALLIYENESGPGSHDANRQRNVLVSVYLQDHRLDDADALNTRQLEILGDEVSPLLANAREDRGILSRMMGRPEEAVTHYRSALKLFAQCPDADRNDVLTAKQNLAFALAHLEEYDEAEALTRVVLEGKQELFGERSVAAAFVLNNLGDLYWRQERFAEARPIFDQAYQIRLERLGETNLDTVRSLYAIGLMQKAEGDFVAAEKTQRRVLELREAVLDPTHYDYMVTLRAIGNTLIPQDRAGEALPLFHRAWLLGQQAYGPQHPRTRSWRQGVLTVIGMAEVHEQSADVYRTSFEATEQWIADGRATTSELASYARDLLFCEVEDLRDPQRALEIVQRAVDESEERDPAMLDIFARALAANGRVDEAIETLESALTLAQSDESLQALREEMGATLAEYESRR